MKNNIMVAYTVLIILIFLLGIMAGISIAVNKMKITNIEMQETGGMVTYKIFNREYKNYYEIGE